MSQKGKKIVKITLRNTKQYLRVLNGMFNLTDKELTVLAAFIDKLEQLRGTGIDVFSAEVKKQVASELDIDDFNTLNVYIKRLKDKNALRYDGSYRINPLLIKKKDEEGVFFKWQEKNS